MPSYSRALENSMDLEKDDMWKLGEMQALELGDVTWFEWG